MLIVLYIRSQIKIVQNESAFCIFNFQVQGACMYFWDSTKIETTGKIAAWARCQNRCKVFTRNKNIKLIKKYDHMKPLMNFSCKVGDEKASSLQYYPFPLTKCVNSCTNSRCVRYAGQCMLGIRAQVLGFQWYFLVLVNWLKKIGW